MGSGACGRVLADFRDDLSETEIQYLRLSALGNEDVCRFDVAVNDSLGVSRVEGIGDFDAEIKDGLAIQRAPGNTMLESDALQVLHRDEDLAVLLTDVVHSADVGMIQGGRGLGFALETRQGLGVVGHIVGQELQGHKPLETGVFSLEDHSHPTTTEFFNDAVMRDYRVEHGAKVEANGCLIIGLTLRRVNSA